MEIMHQKDLVAFEEIEYNVPIHTHYQEPKYTYHTSLCDEERCAFYVELKNDSDVFIFNDDHIARTTKEITNAIRSALPKELGTMDIRITEDRGSGYGVEWLVIWTVVFHYVRSKV